MTARAALRAATAEEHARVDCLFSGLDLSDRGGYRRFLLAQAAAYLPVEAALDQAGAAEAVPDWPARRRAHLLIADLQSLSSETPDPMASPALGDSAAVLGAAYVLEGSRLGGAFLKRSVPAGFPRRFLGAPQEPGSWRKLLAKLDESLYDPARVEGAIQSARQVFARFEAAGRLYLEWRKA